MIELTTGIVFLLSSMYGAGNSNTNIASANEAVSANEPTEAREEQMIDAKEVEQYLRKHYKDTPLLVEIARCESTFTHYKEDGTLLRGRVDNNDVGVMQINERYHLDRSRELGFDIHTIEGNVEYAKILYRDQGGAPWSASSKCWGKTSSSQPLAVK
jgi:prophage tail gpP-like protein